jgi:DNA-binding IscR family transcriptional regulator
LFASLPCCSCLVKAFSQFGRDRYCAQCSQLAGRRQSIGIATSVAAATFGTVLQALVREGILKGVRGPRGGYGLAREQRRITADDILRAACTVDDSTEEPIPRSALLSKVVAPALAHAEDAFSNALSRISVEDLARAATALRKARE